MKKIFTKILISAVMVAIFLAPVSTSFQKNKEGNLAIVPKINIALADVVLSAFQAGITSNSAAFTIKVANYDSGYRNYLANSLYKIDTNGTETQIDTTKKNYLNATNDTAIVKYVGTLSPNTNYKMYLLMIKTSGVFVTDITRTGFAVDFKTSSIDGASPATMNGAPITFTTPNNVTDANQGTSITKSTDGANEWGCSIVPTTWFRQCIVSMVFTFLFTPIAALTKIAGQILDFFVYYSTNSDSYSSGFIGAAWATVRDVSNIFFIIALLYVAIQTILGLGHGGKKMIATIVIVALLINFSMFFTQIIIDASNILAKVFYNHIDSKGPNGEVLPAGFAGEKSITVSLVDVFNPQNMLGTDRTEEPGMAFIVMVIAIILMIYMIVIFLSVSMLFVGRVAGLWIAIIFAPLAFASYTMPFDLPGFGHKEWWSSLLKQAFMAPIFVFFLYVILLLGNSFKLISYDYTTSTDKLGSLMSIIIPFMIVFVLLQQAKKLAVDYSGKMGEAFTKVGGFAMGAIGGAAGLALGAGVGGLAAKVLGGSTGQALRAADLKGGLTGFGARMALRTADYGSKASFDIRKGPVGDLLAKQGIDLSSGMKTIGLGAEATAGGHKGVEERKQEKIAKGAGLYKTTMSDDEVKAWSAEKSAEWEKNKASEQRRLGMAAFNNDVFEEKYGKKPAFTTAAQLDKANLNIYKNNIGKTDLLHSAAVSFTKKATGAELADAQKINPNIKLSDLNDAKIKKTKMRIGIVAAGLAGPSGIAGLGWLGAAVAGGTGAAAYGAHRATMGPAEEGAKKAIEKEMGKTQKLEEEMKTLKTSRERLTKVIADMKTEAGGADLDEHLNTKIAEMESDFASAKDEESIHRKNRIEAQNAKDSISSNPKFAAQSAALEKQIENFKTKENDAKNAALIAMKRKQVYTTAKSAEKDLRSVDTRMDVLEGKTHKEEKKSEGGKISSPPGDGSSSGHETKK